MFKLTRIFAAVATVVSLAGCVSNDIPRISMGMTDNTPTDRPVKECGYEIFTGLTTDHKRTVQVCLFSENGVNYVDFHLDDVGAIKKPYLSVPTQAVYWGHMGSTKSPGDLIIVTDGNNAFSAARGISQGRRVAFISVLSGDEELKIDLDPATVNMKTRYQNGKYNLWDFGLGVYSNRTIHTNDQKLVAPTY